jgi:hypothetical protein
MTNQRQLRLQTIEKMLLLFSAIMPVTLVIVFILGRWPEYWKWIASEDTPMTSLEVTVMYTTALVCWAGAAQSYLNEALARCKCWLVTGFGFLWLAMDDRFAIHERIRDQILVPHNISIPYLPVGPGDFILLIYMVIGLAMLPWLVSIFKGNRKALIRLLGGVAVAAVAVLMDAYDIHRDSLDMQRLEQTVEECLELIAQIMFLQASVIAFMHDLKTARN